MLPPRSVVTLCFQSHAWRRKRKAFRKGQWRSFSKFQIQFQMYILFTQIFFASAEERRSSWQEKKRFHPQTGQTGKFYCSNHNKWSSSREDCLLKAATDNTVFRVYRKFWVCSLLDRFLLAVSWSVTQSIYVRTLGVLEGTIGYVISWVLHGSGRGSSCYYLNTNYFLNW